MQGLPIQQLSKSTKGTSKVHGAVDSKVSSQDEAESKVDGAKSKETKGDFLSLFANLTGQSKDKKSVEKKSEVKSDTGETLKNLLAENKHENKESIKNAEGKSKLEASLDPKIISSEIIKTAEGAKNVKIDQEKISPAVAKASNNLDMLLNKLKGTQDSGDDTGPESINKNPEQLLKGSHTEKEKSLKADSKTENPLEFLMKGMKSKSVGENVEISPEKNNELATSKKVATTEDYLKNIEFSDKKNNSKLTLLTNDGDVEKNTLPQKNFSSNVKSYGQVQNLLNDTMIRTTKDSTNKDTKKAKSDISGVDELLSKNSKVETEASNVKHDVVPALQNKNGHEQSQMQTNGNQKVLDLSKIDTSNTNEIIKKISDYVEQNQVANKSSLDLTVKHESLGEFKIQVTKMPESMNRGLSQIDMQITTSSKEGHDFFVKNEVSLMKNLNQAGVNLSDLRIVSSMRESTPFGQSDSRQSSSFSQNPDGSSKQSMNFESSSFAGNGSEGSQRRKELWEEYQQRYGA